MTDALFADGFKTTPWWWEWATLAPHPGELPDRVAVAVVGGGYAGLNCALELARRGIAVTVFEAERFGFGASSRNGGMVSGGLKLSGAGLAKQVGEERAAAIVDDASRSFPFLEDLIQREGIDCHYQRYGRFVGAWAPKHYRALEKRAEVLRQATGMAVEIVPRERQREEIGSDLYVGGMMAEASGGLHPALFHQGLAAAAARAGARLVDGTRITAITPDGEGFRLSVQHGGRPAEVRADAVMVATNAYTTDATPWFRRRLIPVASYIIATEELDPALMQRLSPKRRMLSDTKKVLNYFRLSPDGRRVIFGGRASFRETDERQAAPRLHAMMCAVWPELRDVKITHSWKGNVAFTFDFLPHMGVQDGVHYALGCQGSGVAMASYLGHQTALKMAGASNRPCAFDGLPFPTRPLYSGNPWFLPIVGNLYRLSDFLDRRAA